jgi:hypothetical protein
MRFDIYGMDWQRTKMSYNSSRIKNQQFLFIFFWKVAKISPFGEK